MVRACVNGQEVNRIICEGVVVDPPKQALLLVVEHEGPTMFARIMNQTWNSTRKDPHWGAKLYVPSIV